MISTFREKLQFGQVGESLIARYLRLRGYTILPAYEKEIDNGKGPRLFLPLWAEDAELITPDLQAIRNQQIRWIEAKHKNMATFYRKKWRWQTGIDKRHYEDYLKVQNITTWPVWLLFLQETPLETNAPPGVIVPPCPTGLFGCPITQSYADDGFYFRDGRRYDMVYWGIKDLRLLASLDDVLDASRSLE